MTLFFEGFLNTLKYFFNDNWGLVYGLSKVLSTNLILMVYLCILDTFKSSCKKEDFSNNKKEIILTFPGRVIKHFSNQEGFLTLIIYLCFSWFYHFIPSSYYLLNAHVDWLKVGLLLLIQDFLQYIVHRLEHKMSHINNNLYTFSHKKHHVHIYPSFDDSFSGSYLDTIIMILIPMHISLNLIKGNCQTLTYFGSIYSCWLTLIHSEYSHPWDSFFQKIGFGTPKDHHIHHRLLKYNFGHLFMYWDKLFGTYKDSL